MYIMGLASTVGSGDWGLLIRPGLAKPCPPDHIMDTFTEVGTETPTFLRDFAQYSRCLDPQAGGCIWETPSQQWGLDHPSLYAANTQKHSSDSNSCLGSAHTSHSLLPVLQLDIRRHQTISDGNLTFSFAAALIQVSFPSAYLCCVFTLLLIHLSATAMSVYQQNIWHQPSGSLFSASHIHF